MCESTNNKYSMTMIRLKRSQYRRCYVCLIKITYHFYIRKLSFNILTEKKYDYSRKRDQTLIEINRKYQRQIYRLLAFIWARNRVSGPNHSRDIALTEKKSCICDRILFGRKCHETHQQVQLLHLSSTSRL